MAIREMQKQIFQLAIFGVLLAYSSVNFALPFSVVTKAGSTLPTSIIPGQTLSAYYTITNKTGSVRTSNFIKYLPPNVSQVTSDGTVTDLCGATFSLQAYGAVNDSCTLELNVNGSVDPKDPNPHHHLFACFADGITCAGTVNPLNLTVTNLVAAGVYYNGTALPGFATGNIQGTSWDQQLLPLLPGVTAAELYGVNCVNGICVAVGAYELNGNTVPGIARSTDAGGHWSQTVIPLPPGFSGNPNDITCNSATCIAVGSYTNSATLAGIALSDDHGVTWHLNFLPLLSPYVASNLSGVDCSGNTCVAVGTYSDSSFVFYAGIAYSATGGSTWAQTVLPLPVNVINENLFGVNCTGTLCIAVGEQETSSNTNPGVAVSNDGGASWTQSTLTLPGSYSDGSLYTISCNNGYCVAVGAYSTPGGSDAPTYPGIAVTTDNGTTWSLQAITTLPSGFISGELYDVKCTGTTCVATGTLVVSNISSVPAIAVSADSGSTWQIQALPNPVGISEAFLTGIS